MGDECLGRAGGLGTFSHGRKSGCDGEIAAGVFYGGVGVVPPPSTSLRGAPATKQSILSARTLQAGLLRGACHRARSRATRWLAMTAERSRLPSHLEKLLEQRRCLGLADRRINL